MHFEPNEIYHIYNRGNNKQPIFFNEKNYIYFLKKVRGEWRKYCDILCYCLMPNHFHFMIVPNMEACGIITLADKLTHLQNLSKAIGNTLSSYIKAINIQNKTTGNLFQKKTQSKCLGNTRDYLLICFYYIHQKPIPANIVKDVKDWPYSPYPDYYDYRDGNLCNKNTAMELLSITEKDFKITEVLNLNEIQF